MDLFIPLTAILCFSMITLGSSGNKNLTDVSAEAPHTYIVYMGAQTKIQPEDVESDHGHHHQVLAEVLGSEDIATKSLRYSYRHTFNGFSATMSKKQADALARMSGVIRVVRSQQLILHTTRSWDFIGLPRTPVKDANGSSSVIIGVIDSGIWPESKSFSDEGMGPVPARWRGKCVNGAGTTANEQVQCNRKIIGSRYYDAGIEQKKYMSGRDEVGHGSHTASTAAGREVPVKLGQLPKGTARGGLPYARIAIYKVCWINRECSEDALLAAIDDAINDGVDVLSMSLGPEQPTAYHENPVAIGAFHAALHGVSVACSVGNAGGFGTVVNSAPWILNVAASTIDRTLDPPPVPAPAVPRFSARGPNILDLHVLKPDVVAPGVDIIAADIEGNYAIRSGTSMASPHAAGAIAYVKSLHPAWSPAAIQSAIITTASRMDNTNQVIKTIDGIVSTAFDFGNGEIQPSDAADPGLVYDMEPSDYVAYLCNTGLDVNALNSITGNTSSKCSPKKGSTADLNYPSFSFPQLYNGSRKARRTVTNVGPPNSTYKATVTADPGITISVHPAQLEFTAVGQKLTYTLTIAAESNITTPSGWLFAWLNWSNGKHNVRSAIAAETSTIFRSNSVLIWD